MSNEIKEFLPNFNYIENSKEYKLFLFNQILNPFSVNEPNYSQEISDDEESDIYFKKEKSNISVQIEPVEVKKKFQNFFNVTKDDSNKIIKQYIGKKKGRISNEEKKEMNKSQNNSKKIHDKYDKFNIINKLNVHSIQSLIEIVNCALDMFSFGKNKELKFLNINSSFKKDVKKDSIENLKKKKLCDILTLNISDKYQKYPLDYNKQLYKKIKDDPRYKVVINFLEENFLFFFQNVYYKSERTINLQKYGVDAFLTLSKKVKLNKDKIKTFKDDKEYIKFYNQCINECYFDGKLMFQLEK